MSNLRSILVLTLLVSLGAGSQLAFAAEDPTQDKTRNGPDELYRSETEFKRYYHFLNGNQVVYLIKKTFKSGQVYNEYQVSFKESESSSSPNPEKDIDSNQDPSDATYPLIRKGKNLHWLETTTDTRSQAGKIGGMKSVPRQPGKLTSFIAEARYWILDDGTLLRACFNPERIDFTVSELIEQGNEKYILESSSSGFEAATTLLRVRDSQCLTLDSEFHSQLKSTVSNGLLVADQLKQGIDLVHFETIPSLRIIKNQQDTFRIEPVEASQKVFNGVKITRLRDGKSLTLHAGQIEDLFTFNENLGEKYTVTNGILSIIGVTKNIDLDRFDAEVRMFKTLGVSSQVLDQHGTKTDVLKEVRESYKNLVSESLSFPEKFTEKADSALIRQMAEAIRGKKSVVLLGKAGTGKSSAVRAFAREVGLGHVPGVPRTLEIYEVKVANLASGTMYTGMIEQRIATLVGAAQQSGCIFFVDEIHSMAGIGTSSHQSNDITQMIKGPMESGEMVLMGTDTAHEFNNSFARDPAFVERFEKITVSAPTGLELVELIQARMSKECEVPLTKSIVEEAIAMSNEFDLTAAQPRAAVNLLRKACTKLISIEKEDQPLTSEFLKEVAIEKYNFDPALYHRTVTREKLLNLESNLDLEIIGQKDAKKAMVSLWKRKFTRVGDPNQIKSLLFVGPPGVGKSRLAEISADLMNYQKTFIEMNKFQRGDTEDFRREVYSALLQHPFRVIILDEIEKAHITVQEAALSMLQSGEFTVLEKTPGGGTVSREVSTKHVLFVLTSNAGSGYIQHCLKESQPIQEGTLKAYLEADGISGAILSRIFKIVPMGRPTAEEFRKGIEFYLKKTLDRERVAQEANFVLVNEQEFIDAMAARYSENLDYRDVKKMMMAIEEEISQAVLDADFKPGQDVVLKWIPDHSGSTGVGRWEPWMGMYN